MMTTSRLHLPSLPKSLEKSHGRGFFHKTHIYGPLWRQMCSIFGYGEELNVWKDTFGVYCLEGQIFQDLIVMADDDDCLFAPTFPSKVLGIKNCFMQLTYMSTYGAKCVHSLVMVRN